MSPKAHPPTKGIKHRICERKVWLWLLVDCMITWRVLCHLKIYRRCVGVWGRPLQLPRWLVWSMEPILSKWNWWPAPMSTLVDQPQGSIWWLRSQRLLQYSRGSAPAWHQAAIYADDRFTSKDDTLSWVIQVPPVTLHLLRFAIDRTTNMLLLP